ncbi:hypothetical protein [Epilithonimonas hispanica]|uniref:Uncharacterized protein n=1 Tax=Epilithonimonas hispanica TaxID=358687 RepID=A0A3D9D042_9FLAO|nr:hypothetical protein [Epilithonimonas hispanica]REC71392.1 hypothetical protein DRF58_06130 [Epilithonimonas hispanica]
MILRGRIVETVEPNHKSVIVEFTKDSRKQHFEVNCAFNPFELKMEKWDTWDFKIKFESEIFTESKNGRKSYFTHLLCDKAKLFNRL